MNNSRAIGKNKETLACEYLLKNGYEIIDRNFTVRTGEIDIIAKDNKTIVFVEVKYRKELSHGLGIEAVDIKKQKKIISAAKVYVLNKKLNPDDQYRFDVISIDGDDIKLYKGAFS